MTRRKHDTTGDAVAKFAAAVLTASKTFAPHQEFYARRIQGTAYRFELADVVSACASLVNQAEKPKRAKRGKGAKRLGKWTQARPLKRRAKR